MKCISCEAEIGPQCPEDEGRAFPICLPCAQAAKEEEMGDDQDTDTSEYDDNDATTQWAVDQFQD